MILDAGIDALLVAARDRLRAEMSLDANFCAIQPDGHPAANCGEFYIALDEGGVSSDAKHFLRELYTIEVTISRRTGRHARDRWDEIYRSESRSLTALERPIIRAIHSNNALRIAANVLAGVPSAGEGDYFQLPLFYTGRTKTRPVDGSWCFAEPDAASFLVRTLSFTGGLRVQDLDVMH